MAPVLPRIIPKLGEWTTAVIGLAFTTSPPSAMPIAWQGWMIYAVIVVTCLEALADPPLRSLAAAKVPPGAGRAAGSDDLDLFDHRSSRRCSTPAIFAWFTGPSAPVTSAARPMPLAASSSPCRYWCSFSRSSGRRGRKSLPPKWSRSTDGTGLCRS
jgi:DHA1 family tetracycline resistance protein-like MFS transporter